MKTKVKILSNGGSYYDSSLKDTVHFSIERNPKSWVNAPTEGTNVLVRSWDSAGELEAGLLGNTLYKLNQLNNRFNLRRMQELTVTELVKELLNLP